MQTIPKWITGPSDIFDPDWHNSLLTDNDITSQPIEEKTNKQLAELQVENETLRKLVEDLDSMLPGIPERCDNCAFITKCYSQCQEGQCYLSEYLTELGI